MANDFIASAQRPVPLQARRDLKINSAQYLGEECYVVKDPTRLKYIRLSKQQMVVWKLLDGSNGLEQIRSGFLRQFPTFRPTLAQIQRIVFDLYQQGLVISTRPGQGDALEFRAAQEKWDKVKRSLMNILFIRLPGVDPTRILDAGYPLAKVFVQPGVVAWALIVVLFSWIFIGVHATEFAHRIPTWDFWLSWETTLLVWLVLGVTKIIHELAHAFACRHFGGECHEIGVAFLVFSPCLYCDVSDSWTLSSKWKRIFIASAGICIELLIASLAFFFWWNTQPGLPHDIAFVVFMVSNISSLLFNLNPLLRLDGYYILSDWLEIPNLRQKSERLMDQFVLKTLMGIEVPEEGSLKSIRRGPLLMYGVASLVYRILLVAMVAIMMYLMLKPWRLEFLGLLVAVFSGGLGMFTWSRRLFKLVEAHRERNTTAPLRPRLTGLALVALLAAFFLVPIPITLKSPARIEHAGAQPIYVTTPGSVVAVHVQPGQSVKQGQLLVELENEAQLHQLHDLQMKQQVQMIELRKHQVLGQIQQIALARESLASIETEIADQQRRLEKLHLIAPCDGKIVQSQTRSKAPSSKYRLASWSGHPLQTTNRGCLLETATQCLSLAPSREFSAVLTIRQLDVESFHPGQSVRIRLQAWPCRPLNGIIESIAPVASDAGSNSGSENGLSNHDPSSGSSAPDSYLATVRIENDGVHLLAGLEGFGKVTTRNQTAAGWVWRQFRNTFRFP